MTENTERNTRENMAKKLKEARLNAGLTAREVAARLGNSDKTVHAWENMHGQPDADMLVKLCEIYDVGIQFFFFEDLPELQRTDEEDSLLAVFRSLNAEGREKVLAYAEDLSLTGRY